MEFSKTKEDDNYNFMKNSFSWALSDETDSIEWFRLLIKNLTTQNSKLLNELGMKTEKEKKENKYIETASMMTNKTIENPNWMK